ncbi:MAG: permease-like cell division protein FtsX [Pseudomonadota bacterium]
MQAGMRAWLRRHAYSFFSSIGTIVRQPVVNLMTITVLAIALSLPLGLYTALENVRELSRNWERLDSISVFLHQELHEQDARRLASRVSNWADVLSVDPVSPTAGLRELAGQTGLDASSMAMDWLDETDEGLNPLPWTLEVSPLNEVNVAELAERIRSEEGVDSVIVDLAWLQRLDALINVFARLVQLLSLLFGAAVLFVIANNVRADIQTRQEEIEVMALVGATAAYVRRPFLYSGLWMGLLGSLLAWGVVMAGLYLLQSPMQALAMTYGSPANLQPPSGMVIVGMVTLSGVLGIVGAVIAVSRQLSLIKP